MTRNILYPAEIQCIRVINECKTIKLSELAKLLSVTRQTIRNTLYRLELKGMVIPLQENGFIKNVSLSKNGKKIADSISHKKTK